MRIRRRPQAQPLSAPPPSDPSTAPPAAPRTQRHWPSGGKDAEDQEENPELHPHPNADAGDDEPSAATPARRAALPSTTLSPPPPQGNVVERCRSLGGAQSQEQPPPQSGGAADGYTYRSCSVEINGHHDKYSEAVIKAGERLANGVPAATTPVAAVAVNVKEETKIDGGGGGGIKKRRGPAVLKEGSRCSRVNGRGWRCSQPTLVGYSLCEHHLGKGRMQSLSTGGGRGGAGQLGRTEPRKNTAVVVPVPVPMAPAAPNAGELRPILRNC